MHHVPLSHLIVHVTERILATFVVSADEARTYAEGLAVLPEGWGGPGVASLDWDYQIRKRYGEQLEWRSEEERQKYFQARASTYVAYENYIKQRK